MPFVASCYCGYSASSETVPLHQQTKVSDSLSELTNLMISLLLSSNMALKQRLIADERKMYLRVSDVCECDLLKLQSITICV